MLPEDSENLPVRRPGGRPPKAIRKTHNRPPDVAIDFRKDPADQILPCTDLEQASHLGWRVADVRAINTTLGLYEKLPMICRGEGCFWAGQCPTAPDYLFQGLKCPIEMADLFRNFVRLVKELEVHPDDHVDLNHLQDLCRIDLQIKNIDMRLQVQGLEVRHVAAVAQKEGIPFYEQIAHPLLLEQGRLREARSKIYKALLASRAEKAKLEAAEGKRQTDMLALMNQVTARFGIQGPSQPIIDADSLNDPGLRALAAEAPADFSDESDP